MPDAGGDEQLAALQAEGELQRLQDLLRHLRRVLRARDAGQEQDELVAAQAGHGVALAHAGLQALRHRLQQPVARGCGPSESLMTLKRSRSRNSTASRCALAVGLGHGHRRGGR